MNQFEDRKFVLLGIFLAIGLVFVLRLFYLQVVDDSLKLSARNQSVRKTTQHAPREHQPEGHAGHASAEDAEGEQDGHRASRPSSNAPGSAVGRPEVTPNGRSMPAMPGV